MSQRLVKQIKQHSIDALILFHVSAGYHPSDSIVSPVIKYCSIAPPSTKFVKS